MIEVRLHKRTTKLTESIEHLEGNSMHWRLVGTVILGSTLGTTKIKSNLNTGQYTGSVPSDHSQGQAMVEPLLLPGITRYINKFFWKATQKRGGGLHTHTSGFDCDWL